MRGRTRTRLLATAHVPGSARRADGIQMNMRNPGRVISGRSGAARRGLQRHKADYGNEDAREEAGAAGSLASSMRSSRTVLDRSVQ